MGAANDDKLPATDFYPYFWHDKAEITLQEFLRKVCGEPLRYSDIYREESRQYKPSMVQNDGTKPVSRSLCDNMRSSGFKQVI